MFDHISIGVSDLTRASAIYEAALEPLGLTPLWRSERAVGFGPPGFVGEAPFAIVVPKAGTANPSRAAHIAFRADSRAAVQAFHAQAVAAGARDDGPPGIRDHYDAGYYAAFVQDLDGNRIEAVFHELAGP
ncbi:MAG: VOC family protein [Myxococcota bacterium]